MKVIHKRIKMDIETKFFVEKLLLKYIEKIPQSKEELFMSDIAHILSIDIVNDLCIALDIYEDEA